MFLTFKVFWHLKVDVSRSSWTGFLKKTGILKGIWIVYMCFLKNNIDNIFRRLSFFWSVLLRKYLMEWFALYPRKGKTLFGVGKFWKALFFISVALKVSLIFRNMETLLGHFKIYRGQCFSSPLALNISLTFRKCTLTGHLIKYEREMFIVVCRFETLFCWEY